MRPGSRGHNRDVESFFDFCAQDRELLVGLSSYCDEVVPYFDGASLEAEQELRWSAIHGEFLVRCEHGLLRWMETREGVDAGMVCEQIAALFDGPAAASTGLPLSFRLADYVSFLTEILNRRDFPLRLADADAARRRNTGSLSGIWRPQPDMPAKDLDRFLTALGTASWLRGAATRHMRSLRRAVLRHVDDELSVSLDWSAFGHTHEVLRLDGTGVPRAWADVHVHGEGGGYVCSAVHVRRLDETSDATLEEEWRLEENALVWVRRVRSPDGDVAELPLRFALEKEKRAPLEPEKRVPKTSPARKDRQREDRVPRARAADLRVEAQEEWVQAPRVQPRSPEERRPEQRRPRGKSPRVAAQPVAPPPRPRGTPVPAEPPPLRPAAIHTGGYPD